MKYAVCFFLVSLSVSMVHAQPYKSLHSFGETPDGAQPSTPLVIDSSGTLYGTTRFGGANGAGSVFKLDVSGRETVLYSFKGGTDGSHPLAGLVLDRDGNLYGSASDGGADACFGGCGVIFRMDKTGRQTILYSFKGYGDGFLPGGAMVRDGAGNLYGTTELGGAYGSGTVFKLDSHGQETVLYNFSGADGFDPNGLISDSTGNLYGTSAGGSGKNCVGGCGLIYKLDTSSNLTILYAFTGENDGAFPTPGLIQDSAGNIYGTTQSLGAYGFGTVFKLDAMGSLTILYTFRGSIDGGVPESGVLQDKAGNLYGTTAEGGNANRGVIFKVEPSGSERVLHSFMEACQSQASFQIQMASFLGPRIMAGQVDGGRCSD